MPDVTLFSDIVRGVDMRSNPLTLGASSFHYAKNIIFEEGIPRTRYGYDYKKLGLSGAYYDSLLHNGGRGVSSSQYSDDLNEYFVIVQGEVYVSCVTKGYDFNFKKIGLLDHQNCSPTHTYSAENYVIFQNGEGSTYWWDGCELVKSKGMSNCDSPVDDRKDTCNQFDYDKSYATFINDNIEDWLINESKLGIYSNGRIIQSYGHLWAGDLLGKRGGSSSDDILKQTESARWSFGEPISTPSHMGALIDLNIVPSKQKSSHQGDLIAFFEMGSQFIDFDQFPRQTRYNADGSIIQKGWNYKKLSSPATHLVSSTGKRASVRTPDDILFASHHGIHFLSQVSSPSSFNDEPTRRLSQKVDPIFFYDSQEVNKGRALGHWVDGSRFFSTCLLESDIKTSQLPFGKGMLSMNQSMTYTDDRTPVPVWEGLHLVDKGIKGIHKFDKLSKDSLRGDYGFIASDLNESLYWSKLDKDRFSDNRDGNSISIPWEVVTGKYRPNGNNYSTKIDNATLTAVISNQTEMIKVSIRTDANEDWEEWKTFDYKKSLLKKTQEACLTLGRPSDRSRECKWFQVKIEGLGFIELSNMIANITKGDKLEGKESMIMKSNRTYNWMENL